MYLAEGTQCWYSHVLLAPRSAVEVSDGKQRFIFFLVGHLSILHSHVIAGGICIQEGDLC